MGSIWNLLGRSCYYLTLPATWLYLRHSHRTRIVIIHDGCLLVVKGWLSDGRWSLPGGGLHKAEDALVGVLRELKEETSLVLEPDDVKFVTSATYRHSWLNFPYELFEGTVPDRPPLRPQLWEIAAVAWVPLRELTATNAEPDVLFGIAQLAA